MDEPLPFFPIQEPAGILAILLVVLATIFWLAGHPLFGKIFKIIPSLVFCYFVPTLLTTLGVIPHESELYVWVKAHILPTALLLLILALDLPGIIRLGPKAGIMLLAGTFGVVIGGPIALWVMLQVQPAAGSPWASMFALPHDIWRGMTALCGSWIGGGANFVALGQMAEASDAMIAQMVIPDVFVANVWMGVLLFVAGQQHLIDRWTGANAEAIRDLEHRMADFQERTARVATLADLMLIVAIGFGGTWGCSLLADGLVSLLSRNEISLLSATTWKYLLVTTLGVGLSFSRARDLEGAGASRIGSVFIYLLVACIGAHANFNDVLDAPGLIVMAFVWMAVHIVILLGVGWIIRAPVFFIALGSQANIGGAASAPIVAAAFHPSLAPVGVLLAIAGYVLGTYAGRICMELLKFVAGV
ncbi:MAG: DUF819 domain-containing protein [Phycisphaerae bacterium]